MQRFLDEITDIKESEFPYSHPREALSALESQFEKTSNNLKRAQVQNDPITVKRICAEALHDIKEHLQLLGFILRSTDVRNAFEVHGPLLRLVRDVLEPDTPWNQKKTKLILSSEWSYSPITYTEIPNLRGFVLIGSPAHEASNPLLIPLAGHELGHSVWLRDKLSNHFLPFFEREITVAVLADWDRYMQCFFEHSSQSKAVTRKAFNVKDLMVLPTISKSNDWLAKQAQETFCDCVGIKLFGQAFLKAFAYLLAPSYASKRSPIYPNLITRAKNQVKTAEAYNIEVPEGYVELFSDFPEAKMLDSDGFQLKVAGASLEKLVSELINTAGKLLSHPSIPTPSTIEQEKIFSRFRKLVPPQPKEIQSLADVINAGWMMYEKMGEDSSSGLKELVLKTIEVFEIDQILHEQDLLEEEKLALKQGEGQAEVEKEDTHMNQPTLFE